MLAYRVQFKKSARKEFDLLPEPVQNKILEALQLLRVNPYSDLLGIKKLKGVETLYRMRFGDYRMVYEVQKKLLLVLVIKLGHRKEVYR